METVVVLSPAGFTVVTITSVVAGSISLVVVTSTKRDVLCSGEELLVLPRLNVVETPLGSKVVSTGVFEVVTTSTVVSFTVVVVSAAVE